MTSRAFSVMLTSDRMLFFHCSEPVDDYGERRGFGGGAGRGHDQEAFAVGRGHVTATAGFGGQNFGAQVKQRLRSAAVECGNAGLDLDGHQLSVRRDIEKLFAVAAPPWLGSPGG